MLTTRKQKIMGCAPSNSRAPRLTLARRIAGAGCDPAVTLNTLTCCPNAVPQCCVQKKLCEQFAAQMMRLYTPAAVCIHL